MEGNNVGTVVQIVGAVVDIRFEKDRLPNLLNAVEIELNGSKLTVEVAQHIGDDVVRCIAMSSTDGLVRGTKAVDTGKAISVPVGKETLSRMFNLLGEPVDNKPAPEYTASRPPMRSRRLQTKFSKQASRSSILSRLTSREERSASSEAQVSARLSLSWSLSIISPSSTAVSPFSQASESVPVKVTTFTTK